MGSIRPIRLYLLLSGCVVLSLTSWSQTSSLATIRKLFEARHFESAKSQLSIISKDSKEYPEALDLFGRIAVEERSYDLSIQMFERAIAENPHVAEYHNWLGVMYGVIAMSSNPIRQAYYAPKIRNQFEEAAGLDPENLQTQWGLINYYTKAPGFLGGSWEKALICAGVISKQDRIQGLRALGFIHAEQGKDSVAEKELMEAFDAEPDNWENTFALAQFYFGKKMFERTVALYQSYMERHPQNMIVAFHLGATSARSGIAMDRGIRCLTHYLSYIPHPNEPAHSDAHMNLGLLYEKKGQRELARKCFLASLKIEPGLKEAREGLSRVN